MARASGGCSHHSPSLSVAWMENLLRHVVAPQVDGPEVAAATSLDLWRVLTHQFGEASAGIAGNGGEIGAQAVPGVAFGVEPGVQGGRAAA